jgi:quinol monooxygenase YgiN
MKTPEEISKELFKVYYQQCPEAIINYYVHDEKKNQAHIVLSDWIEIIYFEKYQNAEAIMFSINRNSTEAFFKTYKEAAYHQRVSEEDWDKYINSIEITDNMENLEEIYETLFNVYYEQCPTSRIKKVAHNESLKCANIVLDECIEIVYTSDYKTSFAVAINDNVYFFDTYKAAVFFSTMPVIEFLNFNIKPR